ncbi:hypothetical protein AB0D27_19140 [Streptomyces sp. NPDC048415]|uniref:hypothetical protein n=1 Tax=Streptomyces sp. NPDC048415 TaxID=3154822 RepID=UPI0034152F7F
MSIKPSIGWLVDMHRPEWGAWRRVDLGYSLWRRKFPTPCVPHADVSMSQVADLIGEGPIAWVACGAPWETSKPSRVSAEPASNAQESVFLMDATGSDRALRPPGSRELAELVLEQLTAFGFGDVCEGESNSPIHSDAYHIEWSDRTRTLSTSEIQRLNGLAAAAGEDIPKRLILITGGGISRPAAAFADRAKAFIYHLDPEAGRLFPVNSRADELLPPCTEPGRYYLEPLAAD